MKIIKRIASILILLIVAIVILGLIEKSRSKRVKASHDASNLQRLIPIKEVEVNGSDLGSTEAQHIWILIHMDAVSRVEKVYHFCNRKHELKQQFLKAIRKAGQILIMSKTSQDSTSSAIRSPAASPINSSRRPITELNIATTHAPDQKSTTVTPLKVDDCVQRCANGGIGKAEASTVNSTVVAAAVNGLGCRPVSYYSSQSDAGYGSNSEVNHAILNGRNKEMLAAHR